MPPAFSRRTALCGALTLPLLLSACTNDDATPAADPDRAALESALDVELALYDVVGNMQGLRIRDALQPLGAVQAHVDALDSALGQPPSVTAELAPLGSASPSVSSSPSPSPFSTVEEAIRAADRAVNSHTRALRTASAEISPLLASIAASDAAVAAFLRAGGP